MKKAKCNNFYIKINREMFSDVTRNADQNEEWDADDLYHTHVIHGFKIVDKSSSWDFILNEKPEGKWYLVCAFYSTGDSFHTESNCLELVSFVKHIDDANTILAEINNDYRKYTEHKYDFNYKISPLKIILPITNKEHDVYTNTWKGYFDRLESVEIRSLEEIIDEKL